MTWYLAKIIYRITCGGGDHQPQFDEQLHLLRAMDAAAAFVQAKQRGEDGNACFCDQDAQLVRWTFVAVAELHCLGREIAGTELYSQVHETDDAEGYINFVRYKAQCISERLVPIN